MMNFSILNRNIIVDPNKPAIITRQTSFSYKQLDGAITKICSYLHIRGIKQGHRAALTGKHNADFVMMLISLWRVGAVPIPINNRLGETELNKLFDAAKPDFILSADEYTSADNLEFESVSKTCSINKNDEGIIIFTSGTTGVSKGVILTVNNLLSSAEIANEVVEGTKFNPHPNFNTRSDFNTHPEFNARSDFNPHPKFNARSDFNPHPKFNARSDFNPHPNPLPEGEGKEEEKGILNDRWLASLPFYHIGGIMILVRAIAAGSTIIIPDSFQPKEIAFFLQEFRPSYISLVPTVLKRLLENHIYPNKELKSVLLGGGPVSNELAREAINKGWKIIKVYGSTETCSMFTAISLSTNMDKLASAGRPLNGNKLKITDDQRKELQAGTIGEIAVAGPTVFKEYLNNEAETQNKKADGYYFTGDLGYVDDGGYLYIVSRRTDLIISGGENISPAEIEQEILKIPGVQQVYVIGLQDEEWGQIPAAAIKTESKINSKYIIESLTKTLAGYKLPKRIIFIDQFPVNELGKVEREKLKKYFD